MGCPRFEAAHKAFLDALDEYWPADAGEVCFGYISDFGALNEELQSGFLSAHRHLARELFWEVIGPALALYPECPTNWLCEALRSPDAPLQPEPALNRLRGLTRDLFGERGPLATRSRLAPLVAS